MTSIVLVCVRNVYSAQNQFPVITQTERMVDRTGKPVEEMIGIAEERESSSAQIRTLFNEQRRTIIAECCEKVSHHELLEQNKNAKFYKKNHGVSNRIFVKFIAKSYRHGGITKIPEIYLRYAHQTEAHRGSEDYYGIIWKTSRIAK